MCRNIGLEFVGPQGLPFKERDLMAFLGEIFVLGCRTGNLELERDIKKEREQR